MTHPDDIMQAAEALADDLNENFYNPVETPLRIADAMAKLMEERDADVVAWKDIANQWETSARNAVRRQTHMQVQIDRLRKVEQAAKDVFDGVPWSTFDEEFRDRLYGLHKTIEKGDHP